MVQATNSQKLTSKQESYCQHLVDGLNQTEAYKAAGYSVDNKLPATVYQAASRLAANSKVVARIQELRDAVTAVVTEKRAWDQVRFIDEAEINLFQSRQLGHMAPANGALKLIGDAAGLLEAQPLAPVLITKVTVVLSSPAAKTVEGTVVDGTSRVLPDADEAE